MYVSRREVRVVGGRERDFMRLNEAQHAGMKTMPGFRWAMVLRSIGYPSKCALVAMWESREAAHAWSESDASAVVFAAQPVQGMVSPLGPAHAYDVAMARGSMTPAAFAALVDWEVDVAQASAFANRWSSAFHAVEDALGSRLLRHLSQPTLYTGLHVAQSEAALKPELLWQTIDAGEGVVVKPVAMDRLDVALLTEP